MYIAWLMFDVYCFWRASTKRKNEEHEKLKFTTPNALVKLPKEPLIEE